uniref:hypothetical protein n=1 Tax=Vibrio cholerae TaxID=666 RepID=UPI003F580E86
MSAVPIPDPNIERNKTDSDVGRGSAFTDEPAIGLCVRTRCPQATAECAKTKPVIKGSDIHSVSCLYAEA